MLALCWYFKSSNLQSTRVISLSSETNTVVLQQGIFARVFLLLLCINALAWYFIETVNRANLSFIGIFAFVAVALVGLRWVICVGWTRVVFDSEGVLLHTPFSAGQFLPWCDITRYRKGFPKRALLSKGTTPLQIPEMLPRLELLWEECERRGIREVRS